MKRFLKVFFVLTLAIISCKNVRIDSPEAASEVSTNDTTPKFSIIKNDTGLIANPYNKDDVSTQEKVDELNVKMLAYNKATLKCYISNKKLENSELNMFIDSTSNKIIKFVEIVPHPVKERKFNYYQYYVENGEIFAASMSGPDIQGYDMYFVNRKMIRWYGAAHKSITRDLPEYIELESKILKDFEKNKSLLTEYQL
jgi:hypothetical protein